MNEYVITEERLQRLVKNGASVISEQVAGVVRTHTLSEHDAEQCKTCKLEGKRSCMYHGYPTLDIPAHCSYKLGVNAEEALRNLNGTHIDVWTKEHDAEIAKKERERVLDNLSDKLETFVDDMHSHVLLTDNVHSMIESLRGKNHD